jgi:hypothetical protein
MKTHLNFQSPTFVPLNNKIAEYSLIYHLNDAYSIKDISQIANKHQALFQKLEIKNQQLNLMYVDSVFVNILADRALEVLLNNVSSFNHYIKTNYKIKLVTEKDELRYFQRKFTDFIHLMLYADINKNKISNGNISTDRIFCFKNKQGELEYYSIYEQSSLQEKLLRELKLSIDIKASVIKNNELKLVLKIAF